MPPRTLNRPRNLRRAGGPGVTNQVQPIFWWTIVSDNERHGIWTKYTDQLYSDGKLTCDCPGWVHNPQRVCKHVERLKDEATEILELYRQGKGLPTLLDDQDQVIGGPATFGAPVSTVAAPKRIASESRPRQQGRRVEAAESDEPPKSGFKRKLDI